MTTKVKPPKTNLVKHHFNINLEINCFNSSFVFKHRYLPGFFKGYSGGEDVILFYFSKNYSFTGFWQLVYSETTPT